MKKTALTLFVSISVLFSCQPKSEQEQVAQNNTDNDSIHSEMIPEEEAICPDHQLSITSEQFILYRSCRNEVSAQILGFGDDFTPAFDFKNGALSIDTVTGLLYLEPDPQDSMAHLSFVRNVDDSLRILAKLDFRIEDPPAPRIEISVNGKRYNGLSPIPKSSRISVRLIPDAGFKRTSSVDARYEIASIDILAQLSLGPPTRTNVINTGGQDANKGISVSLGTRIRQARPGTLVYVRLNDIYRINYKQERIKVNIPELYNIIPLVVR